MSGHYTSHYLAEILRDLFFEESTGVIKIQDPSGGEVSLHFDRGMLYFAEGNRPEDRFEEHLLSTGALPAATVSKLRMSKTSSLELASSLVTTGTLAEGALVPAVRSLVERAVIRSFSWPSGSYQFTQLEATRGIFEPDILFTFECILKGIEGMAHFGPLKEVLLALPGKLRLSDKGFLPVDKLALRPHHGYMLSRMDGSMSMEEISMILPPDDEDGSLGFLYGLAVLGIVTFVPPISRGSFSLRELMQGHHEAAAREERESSLIKETMERIISQTPAEVLDVAPDADINQVRSAFEKARLAFRAARFGERVRERHKKDLAFIETKLGEAFLKMQIDRLERSGRAAGPDSSMSEIDPNELVVRREMVKTEAQAAREEGTKLSERYFQKAREYFAEKDFHNAIQYCRLAIKFNDEMAQAHALMGEALIKNPNTKWQKLAEEAYLRAQELDPWNAEYCIALGMFYKNRGMDIRARRQFEKALEILPSHPVAKSALQGGRR